MPARNLAIRHLFGGGLATDLGSHADVDVSGDGRLVLPFLQRCENVRFLRNGGITKIGGTVKYNATVHESGDEERGIFDYVKVGTAGTTTRRKVCHIGTKIKADLNDGTFSDIFTGLTDDAIPCYNVFEDQLIISSTGDVPKTWDQTTAANLGGSPPSFAFSTTHVNRVWAAGAVAAPSTLYYSSLLEAAEWNGAGNSGTIEVDPSDGDVITGIYPFRGELIVFKGPNKGSIHRIGGRTPATFTRDRFIEGVGAVNQNLIFMFGSDLGYVWADGTVRTLLASERFGDFELGSLSVDINTMLQENVNTAHLRKGWAATDPLRGEVIFTMPFGASQKPNMTLAMDFRFGNPRWMTWTNIGAYCVARMSNPSNNNRHEMYVGGNDGFIRRLNGADLNIDGGSGAITSYVKTPFLHYSLPKTRKTLRAVGLGVSPKGSYTVTLGWRRDSAAEQTVSVDQAGSDVLGPGTVDIFTLDASTLAGDAYRTRWVETVEGGQFRDIMYEARNITVSQDMEIHSIVAVIEQADEDFTN